MRKDVPLDEVAKYKYIPHAWFSMVVNFVALPYLSYSSIMWADQFFKSDRPWIAIPILMLLVWAFLLSVASAAARMHFEMGPFELIKKYWLHNVRGYGVIYTEYREDGKYKADIVDSVTYSIQLNIHHPSRTIIYIQLGGWGRPKARLWNAFGKVFSLPMIAVAPVKEHGLRPYYVETIDCKGSRVRMSIEHTFAFLKQFEKEQWGTQFQFLIFDLIGTLDARTKNCTGLQTTLEKMTEEKKHEHNRAENAINALIRASVRIHESKRFMHSKEAEAIQASLLQDLQGMMDPTDPGREMIYQRLKELTERKTSVRRQPSLTK